MYAPLPFSAALTSVPVDPTKPNWDLFLVIFCVAGVILYGLTLGRKRIVTIVLSIYVSLALVGNLPFLTGKETAKIAKQLGLTAPGYLKFAVFIVVGIAAFFLLARAQGHAGGGGRGGILIFVLVSMLQIGLLISVLLFYLPADTQKTLTEPIRNLFLSENARTIWLILPLVGLFFLKDD